MARTSFEHLRVYQFSEQLADQIWLIVQGWARLAQDTIGKQLIRAADSIGANIAEGTGRGAFQDNRRFVRIARGSLYETRHLKSVIDQLCPMLNSYLKSIGSRRSSANGTPVPPAGGVELETHG